ncbi:HD-GYP domain-containing protein [Paenisporosarcina sp. TG-14]|uniref:HD-GYP domain-containing protein n=1 Tax=Paenisporosarcina sp. TG-14 TaxID=1231057 RepID=UPI0002EC89A3|nr:HD-GYP domain-containing protein [Paenisporosarcina sp. TG-14]
MTEELKIFNPRKNPNYHILAIFTLVLGIGLDYFIFRERTMTFAYIPLMMMVGILSRNFMPILILTGLATVSLQFNSPAEWGVELFFLRWMSYFLVAFIINTSLKNYQKEQESLHNLTFALAGSIDARDKYTSFHSQNVAYYSREIGKAMNLSRKDCRNLYVGGLLHDIGKIGVPEAVLNKPSRLTDEEFELVKQHPQCGYDLLKYTSSFKRNTILDMVLYHHEKFDGTGYPNCLKGKDIPLVARIMAVADAFDAMTSRRVYRNKKELDYALSEISKGKQSQFDPEIADVFLQLIHNKNIIVRGFMQEN